MKSTIRELLKLESAGGILLMVASDPGIHRRKLTAQSLVRHALDYSSGHHG
jgi:hypothetical protein